MTPRRLALGAIVLAGVALRVIGLDRWPGINGDEAWYGVNAQLLLEGQRPFFRTGIGNPLNLFHSLPILLTAAMLPPAQFLLRVPSVIWGSLAVVAAYPLLARTLGSRAALLVTTLLAVSPAAVAYSRFGWDPSATPFFTLAAVALALADRPLLAGLATLGGIAVHPTNVFAVPIIAGAWFPSARARFAAAGAPARRQLAIGAGVLAMLSVPVVLWLIGTPPYSTVLPSIRVMAGRALSPSDWLSVVHGVLRLFAGVTTATHIAGPVPTTARHAAEVFAALLFVVPVLVGWRRLADDRAHQFAWLAAGVACSLVVFQIVALPGSFEAPTERYAMFLLSPLIVLCAMAMEAMMQDRPRTAWPAMSLAVAGLFAVLVGTYFVPIVTRGGESQPSFKTGVLEPKDAAFAFLLEASRSADVVRVVAENWGLYWSLRYLAWPERDRLRVEMLADASVPGGLRPRGVPPPSYRHAPDEEYFVVFDAGADGRRILQTGRQPVFTARDPLGRPVVHVFAMAQQFQP